MNWSSNATAGPASPSPATAASTNGWASLTTPSWATVRWIHVLAGSGRLRTARPTETVYEEPARMFTTTVVMAGSSETARTSYTMAGSAHRRMWCAGRSACAGRSQKRGTRGTWARSEQQPSSWSKLPHRGELVPGRIVAIAAAYLRGSPALPTPRTPSMYAARLRVTGRPCVGSPSQSRASAGRDRPTSSQSALCDTSRSAGIGDRTGLGMLPIVPLIDRQLQCEDGSAKTDRCGRSLAPPTTRRSWST